MTSAYEYEVMLPAKISFGVGSLNKLGEEAQHLSAKHACIITDPGVYQAGLASPVKEQLSKAQISVDVFTEAEPEPTFARLNAIAAELGKENYDLLVGVGGGSSMDMTKGVSAILSHGGKGEDYSGVNRVPGPVIPIFAIPTTSGTGSEVTRTCVFHDDEKGQKLAIISPYLLPRLAVVDPVLTYGCPPKVTASSGIDALVHAIEAYTSKKANDFSDSLAVTAMRLIWDNLRTAVNNGSDKQARERMAEGSLFAGLSFANSGLAIIHAFAHVLGARFHIPHGVANGLFLPHGLEYNISGNVEKHAAVAQIFGVKTRGLSLREMAERGVEATQDLNKDIGIPLRLRDVGVPRGALDGLAAATMEATRLLSQNPRPVSADDVKRIWKNAW
jgi:alcohol dehydrogenase class IV